MHAVLIHGWKGWPENAWFPWLRRELESRGYSTAAPAMPNPVLPRKGAWIPVITQAITGPDTVLIGHSLACPAILFALESYDGPPIEQVVIVSGFGRDFKVPGLFTWFDEPIDFSTVKSKAKCWVVMHAKDDHLVPYREGEWLAEQLGVQLVTVKGRGHLTGEEKVFELPEALDAII